jgi:hypothetical protein
MTRDDIVNATYDDALKLVELKAAYGLTDRAKARILSDISEGQRISSKGSKSQPRWVTPSERKPSE